MLVVIYTDCTGSFKSNRHAITNTQTHTTTQIKKQANKQTNGKIILELETTLGSFKFNHRAITTTTVLVCLINEFHYQKKCYSWLNNGVITALFGHLNEYDNLSLVIKYLQYPTDIQSEYLWIVIIGKQKKIHKHIQPRK